MNKYALIKEGKVINKILCDDNKIEALSTGYDDAIDLEGVSPEPCIGWKYENNQFSIGMTREEALALRLSEFEVEIKKYANTRYDNSIKISIMAMVMMAQMAGRTNQLQYLTQVFTWGESILTYNYIVVTALNALSTTEEVLAYQWNIDAGVMPDPLVSLVHAAQIQD